MSIDPIVTVTGIRSTLKWLVVSTVVIYIVMLGLTYQTNSALCTLKGDLKTRITQSNQFLAAHPNGVRGISPSVIKVGILNEERTIDSLSKLICL